jgi:hypothetical protein
VTIKKQREPTTRSSLTSSTLMSWTVILFNVVREKHLNNQCVSRDNCERVYFETRFREKNIFHGSKQGRGDLNN